MLVMSLSDEERREVDKLLVHAAERGAGNVRVRYTPEQIDERQREFSWIWVEDNFRRVPRDDYSFDAYRWH
jgi:hypothetical protein